MSKINERKLKEASQILQDIIARSDAFNGLFNKMNSKERALIGGMVMSIDSPWDDIQINGLGGETHQLAFLINRLSAAFQQGPKSDMSINLKNPGDRSVN